MKKQKNKGIDTQINNESRQSISDQSTNTSSRQILKSKIDTSEEQIQPNVKMPSQKNNKNDQAKKQEQNQKKAVPIKIIKQQQSASAQKLNAKYEQMKTSSGNKIQISRYYHVSVDKLSNAFENQFLKDLPKYSTFYRQDQMYSPNTFKIKQETYGLKNYDQKFQNKTNDQQDPDDFTADYTVIKAQKEFFVLNKNIRKYQLKLMFSSCFNLMLYGFVSMVLQFVLFFMNQNINFPFKFYEYIQQGQNQNYYFIYLTIAVSRSLIIICSNILIQFFVKERKVSVFNKITNVFYILTIVYLVMITAEKYFLYLIIQKQWIDNYIYIVEQGLNDLTFLIFMFINLCNLYSYNNSMKKFHLFLNTYRQTPRSRNLRKYIPPQEPIYEEHSQFEKSYVGSFMKQSEKAISLYSIQKQSEKATSLYSIQNEDRKEVQGNHSQHQSNGVSVIEYNEHTNKFQEIPLFIDFVNGNELNGMDNIYSEESPKIKRSRYSPVIKKEKTASLKNIMVDKTRNNSSNQIKMNNDVFKINHQQYYERTDVDF